MSVSASCRRLAAASLLALSLLPMPVAADPGDPAGWSTVLDRRGRAFLVYTEAVGGPRLFRLSCLTDVDLVGVMAKPPGLAVAAVERLDLVDGAARQSFTGEVADEANDGGLAFRADVDADAKGRRVIEKTLGPVLAGSGPLVVTVGSASLSLPVAGLAAPAKRFRSVCFGRGG
jgi:hypothetical protein